jgi:peptide chain release factor
MSRFTVRPEKEAALLSRMARLGIREEDLEEQFIRGTGAGGQKVNKTSSTVWVKHLPSGIEVRCQAGRSQGLNRYLARVALCERFESKVLGEKTKKEREISKLRRQKARRARKTKQKLLKDKRHRSEKKSFRKSIDH